MGCSGRVKAEEIRADQKWDFISLSDFKSANCASIFAYVYLLGSLVVSIAVYGVDTFTAVNLIAFNKWAGAVTPELDLSISRWIFSACIIASWVNLAYEYMRALRVIKRGAVAESYLDSLAVRLQCIRWTKSGRGWRRFLVFAELTKSKKGAEYVALFTYFSFQSWFRIIFCQGPRQVVNALTLKALLESKLIPTDNDVGTAIGEFFEKLGHLFEADTRSAVIYSGMLFTLVIWVFGALSLLLAFLFWIFFLWHYVPNGDGGLSGHCEKKINKRLAAIVSIKVNKALEEEERRRRKEDAKSIKKGEQPRFGRQATLPTLFNPKEPQDQDKLPAMPIMNRNDTMATLPAYSSRPGTPGGPPTTATFELDQLDSKRPAPGRNLTNTSFASNAPLMGNASDMGYDSLESPAPSLPPSRAGFPPPIRSMTGSSQRSQWSQGGPLDDRGYTASPVSYNNRPPVPSQVSTSSNYSQPTFDDYGNPLPRPQERSFTPAGPAPSMGRRTPFEDNSGFEQTPTVPYPLDFGINAPLPPRGPPSEFGRNSPAPSAMSRSQADSNVGYQAYNPGNRSVSNASPAPYPTAFTPGQQSSRNYTDPGRGPQDNFGNQRPGTAQSNRPPPMSRGPTDYFGDARPGTAQSNRPPPNMQRNATPAQDYYGGERPATSQSNRSQPSGGQRGPPQAFYGNERPGTAQSGRQPPSSRGDPSPYERQPTIPGNYGDQQGYAR